MIINNNHFKELKNETPKDTLLQFALNELKEKGKSRKQTKYTLWDAEKHKHLGTVRTKTIIDACMFLKKNPLKDNDYYKYVDAYYTSHEKLNEKYFKHNLKKLHDYYAKVDANPSFNPLNLRKYETYVLYISLKLIGGYISEADDIIFNVIKKDNREYNPLTNIPSVLRGELPFKVKEYDIKRAFPTFIDITLKTNHRQDIYETLSKKEFSACLNAHNGSKISISDARKKLSKVYNNRANEVLTYERYNEQGRAFKDYAKFEDEYIKKFIESNKIDHYARLHDGVFVLNDFQCENVVFDFVEFSVKECVKPKVEREKVSFYSIDVDGNVELSPSMISKFLIQEKFVRISSEDDKIQLLKINNNIIDFFNYKTDIVSFLMSEINEADNSSVKDAIARHCNSTIAQSYLLIPPTELIYYKDSKDRFGLPFKNGYIYFDKLDKMELKNKSYDQVEGFFTPHKLQKITFDYTDEIGDFEKFTYRASTGLKNLDHDNINFKSLKSIIGYLAINFKKPNENPIIVFTDDGANEINRNGRRGKSLLTIGLGYTTKTLTKGGNEFDGSYRHNFAELDKSCNLYVIDDAPAGFNYNDLYTLSTGCLSVQPKGSKAYEIPFKDTPKFIVTSNYIFRLDKNDASSVARFIEFKFKPYYSLSLKPEHEFGKLLFDEWDTKEWNKFYSFIFRCVFDYLKNGFTNIDYDKDTDNYDAIFSDAKEDAMSKIMTKITGKNEPFTVTDFLIAYNEMDRSIVNEKFFNHINTKNYIETFIKKHKEYQLYNYVPRNKVWTHYK